MEKARKAITRWLVVALALATWSSLSTPAAFAIAPTVLSVSSTTPNGIYGVGDTFDITITFSQVVFVTDTPTLSMSYTTGLNSNATYFSGSGTNTLTFKYTSPAGVTTTNLEYASTSSLSGVIKNAALEQATLTLPTPGAPGSLSANKQLKFEYFGNFQSGLPSGFATYTSNMAWSSARGLPLSADGQSIISISLAVDTKTVILATGATVSDLQIFGNYMYWISGTTLNRSPVMSPAKTTVYTHTSAIYSFSRTSSYWAIVDANHKLYRLSTDGNFTPTLVTTLNSTIVDNDSAWTSMQTSLNRDKVLWLSIFNGLVTEIDVVSGATSTYADLTKCTINLRGMVRLNDNSEIYSVFGASKLPHRWPDGHVTCSAVLTWPVFLGAATTDGNNLYFNGYGSSASDIRFMRLTPYNTTWQPVSTFDPSAPQPSSLSAPTLSGGGFAAYKGVATTATVTTSTAGKVSFTANGKYIAGCRNIATVSLVATCTWKPTVQGAIQVSAILAPTSAAYLTSTSLPFTLAVIKRTTTR